jgi:hypothetical protein
MRILRDEPKSLEVRRSIAVEDTVIVSSLTELEAEAELRGAVLGGSIRQTQWRQYQAQIAALRNVDPFHFKYLPASVFSTALRQQRRADAMHCRPMDRLHLAAMEELNVRRLMTWDLDQADVAQGLGFSVMIPGQTSL